MASKTSASSTAAVLWLMILLVFLPIMGGYLVARHGADDRELAERAVPSAPVTGG